MKPLWKTFENYCRKMIFVSIYNPSLWSISQNEAVNTLANTNQRLDRQRSDSQQILVSHSTDRATSFTLLRKVPYIRMYGRQVCENVSVPYVCTYTCQLKCRCYVCVDHTTV